MRRNFLGDSGVFLNVVVSFHTPASEQAQAFASDGNYAAAARLAAKSGHSRFRQYGLESVSTNSTLAIGDLLEAICYARQAGNDQTARWLRGSLQAYAKVLQESAHERLQDEWPAMTWACLVGLMEEWIGDAYLFTEDRDADRYYDRARSWYRAEECRETKLDRNSPSPCWQWGMEPAFEKPWAAFERYLVWIDADAPSEIDAEFDIYCFDRLKYKRELVQKVTE